MIMNYKEVRDRIRRLWPMLNYVWLRDKEYECPKLDDIVTMLVDSSIEILSFRDYIFDCDDFSLQLSAFVSRYIGSKDSGWKRPWPFGQVMLRKFQGKQELHNINICVTAYGSVYLIEPQTDEVWKADPRKDEPFFIVMP